MTITDTVIEAFQKSPLLSSGIVAAVVGSVIAMLRNTPKHLYTLVKNRLTVSVEIRDDLIFQALAEWLVEQRYGRRCRQTTAMIDSRAEENRTDAPALLFPPGRGIHLFRCGRRFYWLERRRDDVSGGADSLSTMLQREVMVLRTWGISSRPAHQLLSDAVRASHGRRAGRCMVTVNDGYGNWVTCQATDARPLESVVLRQGVLQDIVGDVDGFLAGRERYRSLGVPYRRGYLLHGPPGCGKSSLVSAIASHVRCPLYLLTLSSTRLDDDRLLAMLSQTLPGSMIVIEDVDAAFVGRETSDDTQGRVTFSGLLNAIDGIAAQQGRIVWFTTNHPERLDAALRRAGRIDREWEIGLCDADQLRRMFLRFNSEEPMLAAEFAVLNADRGLAPCAVQQHLMSHQGNPYMAVATTCDKSNNYQPSTEGVS